MQFDGRATWGAAPPRALIPHWVAPEPVGIAWHYIGAGSFNPAAHDVCLAWTRSTQHSDEAGTSHTHDHYSDIAYNLLCCPHGRVIEGRGLDVQSGAQLGGNAQWVGVLLMRGSSDELTMEMQIAANDARSYVVANYPDATLQVGHCDVAGNPSGTVCPGPFEAWVRSGGAHINGGPVPFEEVDVKLWLIRAGNEPQVYVTDLASYRRHILRSELNRYEFVRQVECNEDGTAVIIDMSVDEVAAIPLIGRVYGGEVPFRAR